jgi:hypothetical protein
MRLPTVITLGDVELHRSYSDPFGKKGPLMEWHDEHYWCKLRRRRDGAWLFVGSPLPEAGCHELWCDTPEEAYIANLLHQRKWLQKTHTEQMLLIDGAIKRAT